MAKSGRNKLIEDLKFCQTLMDRLVKYADSNYEDNWWNSKHTVIQKDIIRLRRELNDIRVGLDWTSDKYRSGGE